MSLDVVVPPTRNTYCSSKAYHMMAWDCCETETESGYSACWPEHSRGTSGNLPKHSKRCELDWKGLKHDARLKSSIWILFDEYQARFCWW